MSTDTEIDNFSCVIENMFVN